MSRTQPNPTQTQLPVWDLWVRLFHWSLALSVLFMLVSGNTGFKFFEWHRLIGEVILALVLFRLIWGMIGSSNLKLLSLIRSPREAVLHVRDLAKGQAHPERGHNAAGSWAVIAMLGLVGLQAISGLFISDEDELIEGAYYSSVGVEISDLMYRVHHTVAEFIQIIVVIHIAMIFVYLVRARQNLIIPMLTGKMKWPQAIPPPEIRLQHWFVGFLAALCSAGVVGFLVGWHQ